MMRNEAGERAIMADAAKAAGIQTAAPKPHWTEAHIQHDGKDYISYDEAGLEHSRHPTKWEAREALVVYAKTQLGE